MTQRYFTSLLRSRSYAALTSWILIISTSLLMSRAHPLLRLAASSLIGTILVLATLQIGDRYRVYDLGLGLLLSLSPVGLFDLAKWWFQRKRQ